MWKRMVIVIGLSIGPATIGSEAQTIRPRVALPCLTELGAVAEIDALEALVSQLRRGQAGKRNAATKAIKTELRATVEQLTSQTSDLNLANGEAAFTARLEAANKAVRRLVNRGRGGFAKRRTAALDTLAALEAEMDASCDDGIFCNGPEACTLATADCTSGPPPCTAPDVCNETNDACEPPPGLTLLLTLGQDRLTGAETDDLFVADLVFNPPTASSLPSLQTGDELDGAGGDDRLTATVNYAVPTIVTPLASAIETFEVTDVGSAATTLGADTTTGLQVVNLLNGINPNRLTIANLGALADLGLANQDVGASMAFRAAATNGGADALTLTLTDVVTPPDGTGLVELVTENTNGIESVTIVSNGTRNAFTGIAQTVGTSLAALTLSGPAPLVLARDTPLPATIGTIDASAATGGTDLTVGGALAITYTGGPGNDVVNLGGTYTTADVVDGGGGVNTIGLNATQAQVAVAQANVTNVARVMFVNTLLGQSIDVGHFGATDAVLDTTGEGILLLNLPSTLTLASGDRTVVAVNDNVNDQLSMVLPGVGTTDSLTYHAANSDHTFPGTAITGVGAETMTILSTDGPDGTPASDGRNSFIAIGLVPTVGVGTLRITGNVGVTITGTITAGVVDASMAGAGFQAETTTSAVNAAGATVTGSPFDDELVGSAGVDAIDGGTGNDLIKGRQGADLCTGGPGADLFLFDQVDQFGDTIADFAAATDQVGLGSGILNFSLVNGTENAPATLSAAHFETGRLQIAELANGDALKVVRLSAALTTAQLAGDIGQPIAAYVLAFDSTLQRGVLLHDADWSTSTDRTLVVRFDSLTTLGAVQALTSANFAEID